MMCLNVNGCCKSACGIIRLERALVVMAPLDIR